ncbi:MAG TPA: sugar nucleotide-binding protein [Candidatus Thermoplasmatota archaeon]
MLRVAITGSTGLVGARSLELLSRQFTFQGLGRKNGFDLLTLTPETCAPFLKDSDAVLHLAARTDVDGIEQERPQGPNGNAWHVNVDGTRALAKAASLRGIPLLFVSTDFVFAAAAQGPFPEAPAATRDANETSWYGWTKLAAERELLHQPRNAILRISYPYVAHHPTLVDHARRTLQLHRENRLYPLYDDQLFTPSFIDDVTTSLATILTKRLSGIFHCASTDRLTPLAFATALLRAVGEDRTDLKRARFPPTQPGKAPRPQSGGLETERSRRAGLRVRSTTESLAEFARQVRTT